MYRFLPSLLCQGSSCVFYSFKRMLSGQSLTYFSSLIPATSNSTYTRTLSYIYQKRIRNSSFCLLMNIKVLAWVFDSGSRIYRVLILVSFECALIPELIRFDQYAGRMLFIRAFTESLMLVMIIGFYLRYIAILSPRSCAEFDMSKYFKRHQRMHTVG